jgi:hypothetical protein
VTVVAVIAIVAVSEWQLHWLLPANVMAAEHGERGQAVAAPPPARVAPLAPAFEDLRPAQPATAAAPAPAPAAQRDALQEAWRGTSVAVMPKDLGAMGPAIKLALDKVQREDMDFCFREPGKEGRMEAKTPRRASNLMLFLETREGAVDVVEARVANAGTLPAAVVECCLEVARGLEIPLPSAEPGKRMQHLYEIEE